MVLDELRYATPARALKAYEGETMAENLQVRYGVKDMDYLGWRVRDPITLVEGPVVSVSYDLNGCIMALVDRGYAADGKKQDSLWTDTKRLVKIGNGPLLSQPVFGPQVPGGREMPAFDSKPGR